MADTVNSVSANTVCFLSPYLEALSSIVKRMPDIEQKDGEISGKHAEGGGDKCLYQIGICLMFTFCSQVWVPGH